MVGQSEGILKIVNKPWGYEKWIAQTDKYVLKEIFMKKGGKSSLQYHVEKDESNYILRGKAELYTQEKIGSTGSIITTHLKLKVGDTFHIYPNILHRVTALSDLTMIEVSTPEVDDVIRVSDDYKRPSGRIESEHKPIIGTDLSGNPLLKNPERY